MDFAVGKKISSMGKGLWTIITLVGPSSSVNVHVLGSVLFGMEHFGADIAFELWREMHFAVGEKIT